MAWADISTYNASELAKTKAEIDEVISAIGAKFIAHRHRNGKITDEEHYATLFVNQTLVPRAAAFSAALSDTAIIATVKGLIEAATYTMTQAEATSEAAVKAEVESVIAVLELDGVATEVEKVSYTEAVAGDAGDPDGTNGSYKFKVNLSKGIMTGVTSELTMTITATPLSDTAIIATVKGLIEAATYTMTQAEATSEAAVKAEVESVIATLELKGVATEVEKVSYTEAVAGDAGDPDGTNGSYKFKVNLSKGIMTGVTSELTMTITATPHA